MNYTKLTAKVLLACSAVLVAACGSDDGGNPGGVEGAFSTAAVWESGCLASSGIDIDAFGLTMFSRIRIDGDSFTRTTQYFSDGTCSALTIEAVEAGTLTQTPSPDGSPTGQIDFNYTQTRITPKADPGTLHLNAVTYCGSNSWQVNQVRDVTTASGSGCWLPTPRTVRDIYSVSGNDIIFGVGSEKEKSGGSRPSALDQLRVWKIR